MRLFFVKSVVLACFLSVVSFASAADILKDDLAALKADFAKEAPLTQVDLDEYIRIFPAFYQAGGDREALKKLFDVTTLSPTRLAYIQYKVDADLLSSEDGKPTPAEKEIIDMHRPMLYAAAANAAKAMEERYLQEPPVTQADIDELVKIVPQLFKSDGSIASVVKIFDNDKFSVTRFDYVNFKFGQALPVLMGSKAHRNRHQPPLQVTAAEMDLFRKNLQKILDVETGGGLKAPASATEAKK